MKAIHLVLAALAPATVIGASDHVQIGNASVVQTIVHTFTHVQTSVETSIDYSTEYSSVEPTSTGTAVDDIPTTIYLTNSTTRTITTDVIGGTTTAYLYGITAATTVDTSVACTANGSPTPVTTVTLTVYPFSTDSNNPFTVINPTNTGNLSMTYNSSTWTSRTACNCSTSWTSTTVTASTDSANANLTTYIPSMGNATGIVITATAVSSVSSSKSSGYHYTTGSPVFTSSGNVVKTPLIFSIVARLLSLTNALVFPLNSKPTESKCDDLFSSATFNNSKTHHGGFFGLPPFFNNKNLSHGGLVTSQVVTDTVLPNIVVDEPLPLLSLVARSTGLLEETTTVYVLTPNPARVYTDMMPWTITTTVAVGTTTVTIEATTTLYINNRPSGILYISTETVAAHSTKTVTAGATQAFTPPAAKIAAWIWIIIPVFIFLVVCIL